MWQIDMLTRLCSHIVFCFDKDVQNDELNDIADKFIDCIEIGAIVDSENILDSKESPTDDSQKFKKLNENCRKIIRTGR